MTTAVPFPVPAEPTARRLANAPRASSSTTDRDPPHARADLAPLIPLWPAEIADTSIEGRTRIAAKLERALRAERQRGLAGCWTYDLARHAALVRALRAELAALAEARRAALPRVLPMARRHDAASRG